MLSRYAAVHRDWVVLLVFLWRLSLLNLVSSWIRGDIYFRMCAMVCLHIMRFWTRLRLYICYNDTIMAIGFGFECGCALPYRLRPVGRTKRAVHAGRKEAADESAAAHAITWLISIIDQRHIH